MPHCGGGSRSHPPHLQHGKTAQRDREYAPDYTDESPRRSQPAKVRRRQKLQPRMRAILGAVHLRQTLHSNAGPDGAQVTRYKELCSMGDYGAGPELRKVNREGEFQSKLLQA